MHCCQVLLWNVVQVVPRKENVTFNGPASTVTLPPFSLTVTTLDISRQPSMSISQAWYAHWPRSLDVACLASSHIWEINVWLSWLVLYCFSCCQPCVLLHGLASRLFRLFSSVCCWLQLHQRNFWQLCYSYSLAMTPAVTCFQFWWVSGVSFRPHTWALWTYTWPPSLLSSYCSLLPHHTRANPCSWFRSCMVWIWYGL